MTGGGALAVGSEGGGGGAITFTVVMSCLTAASGRLLLGYDISVTGGLMQMESFLQAFFPEILRKTNNAQQDAYCIFRNQELTMFVSSLYLAAILSSLVSGHLTRTSAPVYLAEIAPARWRGAFTSCFHFFFNLGMFMADLVNYGTDTIPRWGWRLSLGVGLVPAAVIIVGAALIPDTPNSLVLRGRLDEARASLRRIRGAAADTEAELESIARAVEQDRRHASGAFRRLFCRREYRPHLVIAGDAGVLRSDGHDRGVHFHAAPLLHRRKAIQGSIITDVVSLASIAVAGLAVDRYGRRSLLMLGSAVLILSQVAMAWVFGARLGTDGGKSMPRGYAAAVVALVCVYTAGFGVSWGPLKWVVTTEIFPLEVRPAALGLGGAISGVLIFVQSQSFLEMLCSFKYGTFLFYAGWVVVMVASVAAFLPETRGVAIEAMGAVWERHWYRKRFVTLAPASAPAKFSDGPV
ncbi:sugar transport protein 5-like [Panicum miliaceum]|uniref:Sugar transport protein 5-like n=1 Tax=Panicum miliaceum TaxID=4540 RepID=A0A3L6QIW3_PANMI|nr:sugar transport protein 5-like [Panicum miliaceum]